jgi:ribose transport system permease protein
MDMRSSAARVPSGLAWIGTNASAIYLLLFEILLFSILPSTAATFPHVGIARAVISEVSIGGLVAVGLIVSLSAGVFDLSVGYMVAAGNVVFAWVGAHTSLPPIAGVLAVVGVAFIVALMNTFATVKLRINSFIASLAVGSLLLAGIEIVTGNQSILNVPQSYDDFMGARLLGETRGVYAVLVISLVIWWLLSVSGFGPRIYSTGFNLDAARLAGVNVNSYMALGFLVSALTAGAAGIILVGTINSGSPTIGPAYLLTGFAAAFLGSTQIHRGRFNVWGTLLAVVTLGVGVKGLALAGSSFWAPDLFNGVALLAAVGLSARVRRVRVDSPTLVREEEQGGTAGTRERVDEAAG